MIDEGFNQIDIKLEREILLDIFRYFHDRTFIIISHDMDFVLDVCDRSALMRGGKILDVGTPDEIVKQLTADEKEGMFKN